ncbi:MAG: acetyl-CoA carboxylase carboxyltransferase subunit alpha/beta [Dehalococcoidia bacterium]|nr:acetyl-CoA carboxylase carboxyltransferase subunit alpha/beta [Dehalococcoidia bacterium]MDW8120081.1 carboxyl transferase domain-containing protein [Chloroflexota bacterium]
MVGNLWGLVFHRKKGEKWAPLRHERCWQCTADLAADDTYRQWRVCGACGWHYALTARERIALLADPNSFKEKYRRVTSLDPLAFEGKVPYRQRLFREQKRTGLAEAAVVGKCTIGGVKAVLLVLDFSFLGGGMGCVVGEKTALAFEYARRRKRPVVACITSGGARVQEGPLSLAQMGKAVVAINRFRAAGLPFLCLCASPVTGQAFASIVPLAHLILAEPGAILGLAPRQILLQGNDKRQVESIHSAEGQWALGYIDHIVDRRQQREALGTLLSLLAGDGAREPFKRPKGKDPAPVVPSAWEAVQQARSPQRPGARAYVEHLFTPFVELGGDRQGSNAPDILCGIGGLEGRGVVVIAHQRTLAGPASTSPQGLRKAQRAMRLAGEVGLPLITLIDTLGPSRRVEAEQEGIGFALAETLSLLLATPVPTVGVVIGEGGAEAALALGATDRLLMQAGAILTPASPEETAGLMFRAPERAPEAASALHLTARDCMESGLVDAIVPEPSGGVQADFPAAVQMLRRALLRALASVPRNNPNRLLQMRYQRFRRLGEYTSYFRAALAREIALLRERKTPQASEPPGPSAEGADSAPAPTPPPPSPSHTASPPQR